MTTLHVTQAKPFPWKCGNCGERSVAPALVGYSAEMEHDGRIYLVSVPALRAPRCANCGEIVLDDAANRQISESFRRQLGLLAPEQIRKDRESLGRTQGELAAMLGVAEVALSRWESGGQIQQIAMDRLLRLFFEFPNVRMALAEQAAGNRK
ncbi:MAG TPA: type II TA system antitoxin MqsA family protein [Pirellulales bacterium]|nr:type II TA system antitoxin MqsA family protein [Pirellulales bacterium]